MSKLAEKHDVPLDDKAALIELAREHQRPDRAAAPVPLAEVERHLARLASEHERQGVQAKAIIRSLLSDCCAFRGLILETTEALKPIWSAPQGAGLTLTPAQVAAIQKLSGPDPQKGFPKLHQQQRQDERLLKSLGE